MSVTAKKIWTDDPNFFLPYKSSFKFPDLYSRMFTSIWSILHLCAALPLSQQKFPGQNEVQALLRKISYPMCVFSNLLKFFIFCWAYRPYRGRNLFIFEMCLAMIWSESLVMSLKSEDSALCLSELPSVCPNCGYSKLRILVPFWFEQAIKWSSNPKSRLILSQISELQYLAPANFRTSSFTMRAPLKPIDSLCFSLWHPHDNSDRADFFKETAWWSSQAITLFLCELSSFHCFL